MLCHTDNINLFFALFLSHSLRNELHTIYRVAQKKWNIHALRKYLLNTGFAFVDQMRCAKNVERISWKKLETKFFEQINKENR